MVSWPLRIKELLDRGKIILKPGGPEQRKVPDFAPEVGLMMSLDAARRTWLAGRAGIALRKFLPGHQRCSYFLTIGSSLPASKNA